MKRRGFVMVIACVPGLAWAHSFRHGDIAIGHAWALPSTGAEGQVFFPLANQGATQDALVAARSEICTIIEFRNNDKYDLPAMASITLDPQKPVAMRPTARHLRLMGLKQPLVEGDRFKIVLSFLNVGEIEVEVFVEGKPSD
jgi:periplasmic copper chaperone A